MDKYPAYPGAIPLTGNWESPQRATEIALGFIMQAAFGTGTVIDGLAVTQTVVPGMGVLVGPGSIIFATTVDTLASGFGSIAYDGADPLVKIGINLTSTTMSSLTAPITAGQSQNWLIEAQFIEADVSPVVLAYYNAGSPAVPYTGPANAGTPNNTARTNRVQLQWKAGTAATTGTQITPAPDASWFGVSVVTVANGQASILAGNIADYLPSSRVDPTKLGRGVQPGRLLAIRTLSAGSYTPTAGTKSVRATVVGGGGSGGGAAVTGAGQVAYAGGGGGGGVAVGLYPVATLTGQTVTVGTGGIASSSIGFAGTTSSIGAVLSATGGSGGAVGSAGTPPVAQGGGGGGGGVGGNVFNGSGAPGGTGIAMAVNNAVSGVGGGNPLTGGIIGPFSGTSNGNPGFGPGSGSSGACSQNGGGATASFGGIAGTVIVEEFA